MKKLLAVAAVTLALGLPLSAAWAQNYGPQNFIEVSDQTVQRGQPLTATACCFIGQVNWVAQSTPRTVGTSFADVNGVASITFTIPSDFENGTHTITASGTGLNGSPLSLSTSFTVTGGTLIPTGSKTLPWVLVGVGSVVVGGGFLGFARRRGNKTAPSA